jgi:hydroxypyruvate reductase
MKSFQEMREELKNIFNSAIKAADPYTATIRTLEREGWKKRFKEFESIYVIGAGKASYPMAKAVVFLFNEMGIRIKEGIILIPTSIPHKPLQNIIVRTAGHPLPDQSGVDTTKEIIDILNRTHERDLVITLLSGGGSSLLVQPQMDITLKDYRKTTDLLLKCGADIREMNTIRKHISKIKGGQLAKTAYPATVLSLVLSDVVGDPLDVIASGPTTPDLTTFKDCSNILSKYSLAKRVPKSIQTAIEEGLLGKMEETPKPGEPYFERTEYLLIGNNLLALQGAKERGVEYGYHSLILSSEVEGETRKEAKKQIDFARNLLESGNPHPPPVCLISGGETTVNVVGDGMGGRNQEFALQASLEMEGLPISVLSGGTDGKDGNTEAAGAICDGETVRRAKSMGLDPEKFLAQNDSYTFFKKLNDLVITGPTNTNVMDLHIILIGTT